MKLLVASALLVACGAPPAPSAPSNTSTSKVFPLPSDGELGVLGVVPHLMQPAVATWIPSSTGGPFLPMPSEIAPETTLLAIDGRGAETRATVGLAAPVNYGCDGNQLQVATLTVGPERLNPGVLWMRPLASDGWHPKALSITSGNASADRRAYQIGPLTVGLARIDAKHGTLDIAWNARTVHHKRFERHDMAGADNERPIDLAEDGEVAVPVPEAAWSIAGEGAVVLVFRVHGYEGVSFETMVVNPDSARASERMAMYLYSCAF